MKYLTVRTPPKKNLAMKEMNKYYVSDLTPIRILELCAVGARVLIDQDGHVIGCYQKKPFA